MSTHEFSRELVDGVYNINNPLRVDAEGNQIRLYDDLNTEESFAHKFNICCSGPTCQITFNYDLSPTEIAILTTLVNNHKNNL